MQISIFPKALAHPATKEDKVKNALYVSKPYHPQIVDVSSEDDLIKYVTSYAWSPSIFSEYRNNDGFISTDFMVLDIDQGLTIEQAEARCERLGLCHLILPSPSFTLEHHKFRLIFLLVETIYSKDVYDQTWQYLQSLFPEIDKQCCDYARFYYGSKADNGVWGEGDLLSPIKLDPKPLSIKYDKTTDYVPVEGYADLSILEKIYGKTPDKIPKRVDFFLKNAPNGLPGEWIVSLNHCCFTLALQGVEEAIIQDVIESLAPEPLDKRDLATMNRAIKDGSKSRIK